MSNAQTTNSVARRPARRMLPGLLALLALLLLPSAAAASISFTSSQFSVRKGEGDAIITVVRSNDNGPAQVRYGAWHKTAQPDIDYTPVGGRLDFADGQREASFRVPIRNDGLVKGGVTVRLGLYGAYPDKLADPSDAILTILDPAVTSEARDQINPLQLNPAPTNGDPLSGARFFVDRDWGLASVVAHQVRHQQPSAARSLDVIASQPEAKRFGTWNTNPRYDVAKLLARARHDDPGSVPVLATYRLKHIRCSQESDSPAQAAGYKRWYSEWAAGIGNARAVIFLEIDALITTRCLSHHGLNVRIDELRSAIDSLSALPHAVVYVDAGAADARTVALMVKLLRKVHVEKIRGFFTNSTHYDWTSREIRYGRAIVRHLGPTAHYVVNTAVNGRGPLVPHSKVKYGNELRCNPPGRGLGPKPTGDVPAKYRPGGLDGFFWIGNPGRSGGDCGRGEPPTGQFFLKYALMLIKNANFRIR